MQKEKYFSAKNAEKRTKQHRSLIATKF